MLTLMNGDYFPNASLARLTSSLSQWNNFYTCLAYNSGVAWVQPWRGGGGGEGTGVMERGSDCPYKVDKMRESSSSICGRVFPPPRCLCIPFFMSPSLSPIFPVFFSLFRLVPPRVPTALHRRRTVKVKSNHSPSS